MRKMALMMLIMLIFLFPAQARALGNVHISLLSVDIWPEYDQPAVLMIYHVTLTPNTTLPASLSFHLSSDVQVNAVAMVESLKGLVNAPYNLIAQDQGYLLEVTTDSLNIQIEYYEPLTKNGVARHIVFRWKGDYAVDMLEMNFLQPFGANNVSISLSPVSTSLGQDGLTNYHVQIANLASGQPFALTIDYQRNTDDLSISSLPVQAASTPGPDTPGRFSMLSNGAWAFAGIGVLLIAACFAWFVAWQRGGQRAMRGKMSSKRRKVGEDEFTYCHECGKRAQPGDVFCRTCGTRLRRVSSD